jgi:hypothetical protein
MVGAGQHEQPGGDKVVAGVDTRRPRAGHWACGDRRSPPSFEHTFHERQGLSECGASPQSQPLEALRRFPDSPLADAIRRTVPDGAGRWRACGRASRTPVSPSPKPAPGRVRGVQSDSGSSLWRLSSTTQCLARPQCSAAGEVRTTRGPVAATTA